MMTADESRGSTTTRGIYYVCVYSRCRHLANLQSQSDQKNDIQKYELHK